MQNKMYFIVGSVDSGIFTVARELESSYRNIGKDVSIKRLGRPQTMENSGARRAEETLEKLEEKISNNYDTEVLVFTGWRIPDHISQIYNQYKDKATFIFVENQGQSSDDGLIEELIAPEKLQEISMAQKESISNFVSSNAINLNYQAVTSPVFDNDRNLNLGDSTLKIAILGSM